MIQTLLALSAAALVAASPAVAAKAEPAPAPVEAPKAPTVAKRYCIVETPTGSRIPLRTCKSRAEWLATGLDPAAK